MKMLVNLLAILCFFVFGCASPQSPQQKDIKSPLSRLRGGDPASGTGAFPSALAQGPESSPALGNEPNLNNDPPNIANSIEGNRGYHTRISGVLLEQRGMDLIPLRGQSIELIHHVRGPLVQFKAQRLGAFKISGIFKNGHYKVCIISSELEGCNSFQVKDYKVAGIQLIVNSKQQLN